jgi:hypothetical protein
MSGGEALLLSAVLNWGIAGLELFVVETLQTPDFVLLFARRLPH